MKVVIEKIGVPNNNGVIYTREAIEEALKKVKEPLMGTLSEDDEMLSTSINPSKISHAASNLRIEDDALVADIKVLNTPMGHQLKYLLDNVVFRTRGIGKVSDTGEVSDFILLTVSAVSKEKAAW